MKNTPALLSLLLLGAICFTGCAAQQPRRIQAGGAEAYTTMGVDLYDFKDTASQLTQAILASPPIATFAKTNGRAPVLNIGAVINKTDVSIDLGQIVGRINEDLLNSGMVEIVASDAAAIAENEQDAAANLTGPDDDRADFYLEGVIMMLRASFDDGVEKSYSFQLRLNNRARRTVFQKTIDMAKQGDKASAVGW